jgi:hypothetical protein
MDCALSTHFLCAPPRLVKSRQQSHHPDCVRIIVVLSQFRAWPTIPGTSCVQLVPYYSLDKPITQVLP